jgi:hypothetical protein
MSQDRPLARITAGMGELQADQQIIIQANRLDVGLARHSEQPFECRGIDRIDHKLARIGPSFRYDCAGLAPDQLGPAGAEALETSKSELARRAVELAVAALHGLNRQPIPDESAADSDRLKKRRQIGAERNIQAQSLRVRCQGLACLVSEVSRHASHSFC